MVAKLAEEHGIDVVILAECQVDPGEIVRALNRSVSPGFQHGHSECTRISLFARFPKDLIGPAFENDWLSIRRVVLPKRSPVLLAAVHLVSKRNWSDDSQTAECTNLAEYIIEEERKAGHCRTIIVGDFNMNPFEAGFASSAGLNAVMSRQIAARETRKVLGRDYRFFYNPMWNHFGDARGPTAGSYFHDSAQHINYYWHVFDQVLLRPSLAERFDPSTVKILTAVGSRPLVGDNGRPDRSVASDHLPLIFEVEF